MNYFLKFIPNNLSRARSPLSNATSKRRGLLYFFLRMTTSNEKILSTRARAREGLVNMQMGGNGKRGVIDNQQVTSGR